MAGFEKNKEAKKELKERDNFCIHFIEKTFLSVFGKINFICGAKRQEEKRAK